MSGDPRPIPQKKIQNIFFHQGVVATCIKQAGPETINDAVAKASPVMGTLLGANRIATFRCADTFTTEDESTPRNLKPNKTNSNSFNMNP